MSLADHYYTSVSGPEGKLQDTVTLVDMGAQVANGMAFLEKKNILHRELAAQNVLVGEGCICKVYNFGLTRIKVQAAQEQGLIFPSSSVSLSLVTCLYMKVCTVGLTLKSSFGCLKSV